MRGAGVYKIVPKKCPKTNPGKTKWIPGILYIESPSLWACTFLLNLQCVIGANSSYKSSCLMSLPRWSSKWRCHQKENSSREYYTLISLLSQTIFKQLHMQPFKHPCIVWGIHLPDIVLPWQTSSCQNIPFIHMLQLSFEDRHYLFFIKKYYPYKIYSSPQHAAFLS